MVGFKKKKLPVSRQSAPAPAKSFNMPTSDSNIDKGQSVRDDAAVHRPTNKGGNISDLPKPNTDTLNEGGLLSTQQQNSALTRHRVVEGAKEFWSGDPELELKTGTPLAPITAAGGPAAVKGVANAKGAANTLKTAIKIRQDAAGNAKNLAQLTAGVKRVQAARRAKLLADELAAAEKAIAAGQESIMAVEAGNAAAATVKAGQVASNTANARLVTQGLSKYMSPKTQAWLTVIAGYVTTTGIGLWGQSEANEPISFRMDDLREIAKQTDDWSMVEESEEMYEQLTNPSLAEKIGLATPLGIIIGTVNKILGGVQGWKMNAYINEQERIAHENGESDDEKYARIRQQQLAQDQMDRDERVAQIINEDRIRDEVHEENRRRELAENTMDNDERTANAANANAIFDARLKKQRAETLRVNIEADKRKADFWTKYWDEVYEQQNRRKLEDASSGQSSYEPPSQLGFGLL